MTFADFAVIVGVIGFTIGVAITKLVDHYRRK